MQITKNTYKFPTVEPTWKNIKTSRPSRYIQCLVLYESRDDTGMIELNVCCAFYNGDGFVEDKSPFRPNAKLNFPIVAYMEVNRLPLPKQIVTKETSLF